jgi:hypothetical protein
VITGAYVLLTIGGILYLGGWVMLLVLGFKKSIGWGLTILFLSWLVIPLIVFLVKYWDEARIGFLIMISGMLVSALAGFILVGSMATSAMAEFESLEINQPQVSDLPYDEPDEQPSPAPSVDAGATDPALEQQPETAETLDWEDEEEEIEQPQPAGTVLGERVEWVPLANTATLGAYVDELVELHMKDGAVLRVTLDDIDGNSLRVTQRMGGGALGYPIDMDLIDEIYVMK